MSLAIPPKQIISEIVSALEAVDPQDERAMRKLDGRIRDLMLARTPGLDEYICPRYTTSLDAAMTLVPEGLMWFMLSSESGGGALIVGNGPCYHDGYAPTAALALCVSALKALEAYN